MNWSVHGTLALVDMQPAAYCVYQLFVCSIHWRVGNDDDMEPLARGSQAATGSFLAWFCWSPGAAGRTCSSQPLPFCIATSPRALRTCTFTTDLLIRVPATPARAYYVCCSGRDYLRRSPSSADCSSSSNSCTTFTSAPCFHRYQLAKRLPLRQSYTPSHKLSRVTASLFPTGYNRIISTKKENRPLPISYVLPRPLSV